MTDDAFSALLKGLSELTSQQLRLLRDAALLELEDRAKPTGEDSLTEDEIEMYRDGLAVSAIKSIRDRVQLSLPEARDYYYRALAKAGLPRLSRP